MYTLYNFGYHTLLNTICLVYIYIVSVSEKCKKKKKIIRGHLKIAARRNKRL